VRLPIINLPIINRFVLLFIAPPPYRSFRLKVPDNLKRTLVGVSLHLLYEDNSIVVDEPNQVLTAPDKSVKKKTLYTCAALDSALNRYLGEITAYRCKKQLVRMPRGRQDGTGEQGDVYLCSWCMFGLMPGCRQKQQ
jgi:hypothetical protein